MLWRLSQSSSLQTYRHGDSPCSIVLYDRASEELCSALCGRLLSSGFDLILLTLDSNQSSGLHDHLQEAYPKKSITLVTPRAQAADREMQTFSDTARLRGASLFVSCIRMGPRIGEIRLESLTRGEYPIQRFADTHKAALPHLVGHAPSALVIVANTLSPSLEETSEYFKSFAASLSEQLHSHGHKETEVTFMEYFESKNQTQTNSFFSPSPAILSSSILRALGRNSAHVIPYWPHELYSWLMWCLILILPSSLVVGLVPV